ncbi:peptidoglycan DD-metalloendopeptidase family protein [Luteimonas sp. 50]|uniref:Peptidoglycan DD-metalloendopeptidase family protein n=1 Tax=Cognatiluteimonas sedimenti TaxID=2927791 RepID=A0ABT0A693_9GAMM|nr:peptidoglycan DD-metalloendopeptidase family protein [Lysobacter sedimenti]MCJ0826477.1 peptidoglycan DD-metalloendopeptidase family protein [Lysobacter sedimenti]
MSLPESRSGRRARLDKLREAALHRKVLAKHLPAAFNGRWTRRHWAHASLFATLGALVAAIVPGFSNPVATQASLAVPRTTLALALPALPLAKRRAPAGDNWQLLTVQPGQTLGALFEQLDLPSATMHKLLEKSNARSTLARLRPGAEIGFDIGADGTLRSLRYDRDDTHRVELSLVGDEVRERVIERPTTTRTVVISGEVGRSLFWSARRQGLSGKAIRQLTDDIFKYDIDFNEDVAASDRYSVVVDQVWREGELIGTGDIQAATFTAHGKLYSGFRFEHDGKAEYFTADGRPLKKAFIRMPVQYTRISSGFSGARKHPILGRTRAHQGVDFAARSGTPIMAAGNARVAFVGWKGGYGRTVILDHGRGYTTLYGHMSRFGKERVGQRIAQGALIGYVGMTGLATGPHLHYEFRVNGVHRNPLAVTMPPPEPLRGAALAQFRAQTGKALAQIRKVEDVIYADADTTPPKAKAARKG